MIRLIVQLATGTSGVHAVNQFLQSVGASELRPSHAELPDVYTTVMPDTTNATTVVEQLKHRPDVKNAEIDVMRVSDC